MSYLDQNFGYINAYNENTSPDTIIDNITINTSAKLPFLNPDSFVGTDSNKNLTSIGATGGIGPVTVNISGATATFSIPQNIRTTDSVQFAGITGSTGTFGVVNVGGTVYGQDSILPNPSSGTYSINCFNSSMQLLTVGGMGLYTANTTFPVTVNSAVDITGINGFAKVRATSNQLRLGNVTDTTISAPTPAASRVITLPDAGTNSSFVLTESNQTINGNKTFTGNLDCESATFSNITDSGMLTVFSAITNLALDPNLPVKTNSSKALVSGAINLTSEVNGILPIANGGTNNNTSLTNGKLMVSSSGRIAERTSSTDPTFTGDVNAGRVITTGDVIVNGNQFIETLTASMPIKTDANKKLTSGLIDLSSDITGTLSGANVQAATTGNSGTLTTGAQTIAGDKMFTGFIAVNGNVFTNGRFDALGGIVAGGIVNTSNTTDSTSTTNGAIITAGGLGVAKNLNVGGIIGTSNISISSNLDAQNAFITNMITCTSLTRMEYYLEMRNTASQTIANGAVTGVIFTGFARASNWMPAFPTDTFTAPISGFYLCTGSVAFAVNSTGIRYLSFWNAAGTVRYYQQGFQAPTSGDVAYVNISGIIYITAGDSIVMNAFQTSGGNLDIGVFAGTADSFLSIHYMHS